MRHAWIILLVAFAFPAAAWLHAQPPGAADTEPAAEPAAEPDAAAADDEEATHAELRKLRDDLTAAVNDGDYERQLTYVHENAVVVWQNNEVTRGHDGLRDFLGRMGKTGKSVFQGYRTPPEADEPTILFGDDAGVVYGTSQAGYKMFGIPFQLKNRWTATVVKDNDRWVIANYHVSANVLDNAVLYWVGGFAALAGLLLGVILSKVLGKMRKSGAE